MLFANLLELGGVFFTVARNFFFGRQNLWPTQNSILFDGITGGQAHFSNSTPLFLSKAFFSLPLFSSSAPPYPKRCPGLHTMQPYCRSDAAPF